MSAPAIRTGLFLAPLLISASLAPECLADDGQLHGSVTFGAGVAQDYPGSDDYQAVPVLSARLEWQDMSVETDGAGLRADVLPVRGVIFGPVVRYNPGRSDVGDAVINRLTEVEDGMEAGLQVGLSGQGLLLDQDRASVIVTMVHQLDDEDGGNRNSGASVDLAVSWSTPLCDRMSFGLTAGSSWASQETMDAWYSVNAADAARSGLTEFQAQEGFREVSLGTSLSFAFTDNLQGTAMVNWSRQINDAARSPVTDARGQADGMFAGTALTWSF